MRVVVIGLGIQGRKRIEVAGGDLVATIDPVVPGADHRDISEVPSSSYDAALVCTPDAVKAEIVTGLLAEGKHVLVEKPLRIGDDAAFDALESTSRRTHAVCYTAYNHRFEPHIQRMKAVIDSSVLGRIYSVRLFYGNGTARQVRESRWRDQGAGVLPDLGSHLLDLVSFWFGRLDFGLRIVSARRFENRAFDHVTAMSNGTPMIALEMSLLSWHNHFAADVLAEKGSAHIHSLCKWGPATFILRDRKLPSGRPDEQVETLDQPDPTWRLEYDHFKSLCGNGTGTLANDRWLNRVLSDLEQQAMSNSPI